MNKKNMLPIHGQFKLPSEASNNSPLTEVFTDYFALDGMLWPPKYDPTPLQSCRKAVSWLLFKTLSECIWL